MNDGRPLGVSQLSSISGSQDSTARHRAAQSASDSSNGGSKPSRRDLGKCSGHCLGRAVRAYRGDLPYLASTTGDRVDPETGMRQSGAERRCAWDAESVHISSNICFQRPQNANNGTSVQMMQGFSIIATARVSNLKARANWPR